MRVLLVDDDPEIALVARLALERFGGHRVALAATAEAALAAARAEPPDVLILDVLLPDATGPELLDRLRGVPALAGVPAVFLTGKTDDAWAARLSAAGAAGVIAKPFDPTTLAADVERLLHPSTGP